MGRQFDVLVNYNLAYKNDRRIINPRPNLAKETSTILTRCFLISYGNLVITFLIIAIWFNVRGKQRKQQKLYMVSRARNEKTVKAHRLLVGTWRELEYKMVELQPLLKRDLSTLSKLANTGEGEQ